MINKQALLWPVKYEDVCQSQITSKGFQHRNEVTEKNDWCCFKASEKQYAGKAGAKRKLSSKTQQSRKNQFMMVISR